MDIRIDNCSAFKNAIVWFSKAFIKYIVNDKLKWYCLDQKPLLNDKEYDFCKNKKNQWWGNYAHVSHGNLIENWKRENR